MKKELIYLFCACVLIFYACLIFIYINDHHTQIIEEDEYVTEFHNLGLNNDEIAKITHDYDNWYYEGDNLCVGYGDFNDFCDFRYAVCSGGKIPETTFGNLNEQAKNIVSSIKSMGREHKNCPLIY